MPNTVEVATCAGFAFAWPEHFPRPDEATNEQHRQMVKEFASVFGPMPLGAVTRAAAYEFGRKHPSAVRYLHTMYEDAIRSGVIDGPNPWVNLRVASTLGRTYSTPPTAEQIRSLEAVLPRRSAGAVLFAGYTMLRLGELLGVRWSDIDGDVLHLDSQLNKRGVRKPLKGRSEPRDVFLPPEALEAVRDRPTGLERVWPLSRWELYRDWRMALGAAGLDFDFHELRHFGAQRLVDTGVATRIVAKQMGHRDDTLVRRLYGRRVDDCGVAELREALR